MKAYIYKKGTGICRKALAFALALLCALPAFAGCAAWEQEGAFAPTDHAAGEVCKAFYDNILNAYLSEDKAWKDGYYAEAYALISADSKCKETQAGIPIVGAATASPDGSVVERTAHPGATAEPLPEEDRDSKINYVTLRSKYENIYEAIGLEAYAIQVTNVSASGNIASVDFQLTYQTSKGGILNYPACVMQLRRQSGRWMVLWEPSLIFPMMEWGDVVLQGVLQPKRGEIFAADGTLLAKNTAAVTIFAVPSKIPLPDGAKPKYDIKELFSKDNELLEQDEKDEKQLYADFWNAVSAIPELNLDEQKVRNAFARTYQDMAKLTTIYPDLLTPELESRMAEVKGLAWDVGNFGTVREYPYGDLFGHFTGYAGIISIEQLTGFDKYMNPTPHLYLNDPFYDGDSWVGNVGLENQYEEILRGEKGAFAYIQSAAGKNKETLFNTPAKDGEDIHLTLKPYMQERVREVCETIVIQPPPLVDEEGKPVLDEKGKQIWNKINYVVIVMNPKTGEVEAMYSSPGYDPNPFSRGDLSYDAWEDMKEDPEKPLVNRNIQEYYPPGSTFKTMTAAIALESGVVGPEDEFPSGERVLIGSRSDIWYPMYRNGRFAYTGVEQVARTANSNRHKPMNMRSSLIDSDNIYFAWVALCLGWDTYRWYLEKNGMNEAIPFDMKVLPAQFKRSDSEASYNLLAMTGYGQGELQITPLQMACYTAAFANEGHVPVPYIIKEKWQPVGTEYEKIYEFEPRTWKTIATPEDAALIAEMMWGVCRSRYLRMPDRGGTGMYLEVTSYEIAGKTGTTELGKNRPGDKAATELAWFIGFRYTMPNGAPVPDEDQRLVLVMLELDMGNLPPEYTLFKFKIAQALLKSDDLTRDPTTQNIITEPLE
ncbi:MAG: penicillin-binding transpeptidase domain-containing protein [Clostridiales bacterium]|nr:penicillin-binding transpeptidase domain-containing protein [Clostridiales bacterium]